ncbi:ROT1-like protein, partial [Aureobasidium melanogenum]
MASSIKRAVVTLSLALALASSAAAQYDTDLVGTWTTKSKKVMTGPGFYNPVADRLIEPELTGISYSFTSDGYYEEAYYRAISNPAAPNCPSGIMQWQHGTYSLPGNGSIVLEPFGVDGRQLTSTPCSYDHSIYIRYEQPELFKSYEVLTDPYHNVKRLNLFKFDGSPMQPMYLAATPPQMLPTQTLNPTSGAPTATGKSRVKRSSEGGDGAADTDTQEQQRLVAPMNKNTVFKPKDPVNPDRWWWAGVGLTALGTALYMLPTST